MQDVNRGNSVSPMRERENENSAQFFYEHKTALRVKAIF